MVRALGRRQPPEVRDQIEQLRLLDLRRAEGRAMTLPILEVSLEAHGSEEKGSDFQRRRVRRQPVLQRAHAAGFIDGGAVRIPRQRRGSALRVARRESGARVRGVRPEVNDPPIALADVDLHDVARGVAQETSPVSLVRRAVVESRFRECEDREDLLCAGGDLGEHHCDDRVHALESSRAGDGERRNRAACARRAGRSRDCTGWPAARPGRNPDASRCATSKGLDNGAWRGKNHSTAAEVERRRLFDNSTASGSTHDCAGAQRPRARRD